MPFIGAVPAQKYISLAKQDFTTIAGTGYTLDQSVTNEVDIALFINNVRQIPTTAYTASGTTLTLTSATTTSDTMYCVFLGKATETVNPPNGSVGTDQLEASAVTTAKIADNAVTDAKINASLGKILQVIQTEKTDTFSSTTFNSWTDITGMSASITPSSTSSKIYVVANINGMAGNNSHIKLLRGTTDIYVGDAASNRQQASSGGVRADSDGNTIQNNSIMFLDSPSTTSATTYKIQFWLHNSQTFYLNRSVNDNDATYSARSSSNIILMEVAG